MERRIKVVHLITRLDLGGAQQNTLYTCRHLSRARFDCVLASGRGGLLDPEAGEIPDLCVRWIDSLVREINPLKDLAALIEIASLLSIERPDVLHTHSSKAGVLGRLAAGLVGVPLVVHTFHGFGFNDTQPNWLKASWVALERLAAVWTDVFIFVSKANRQTAEELGIGRGKERIILRSGVKLSGLPAAVADKKAKKMELGIGLHKPLVISIGNFKLQKNPEDFIRMARLVHEKKPDADFLFIGDGPLRNHLEAQVIEAGLSNRVNLPGWRRDAAECLAVSDLFVLTSLWEGLPRALVEAMKSGVPPVCYATDGVKDLIEDGVNGFLVAVGDVQGLAGRVVQLLEDEALRARLGQAAAKSIGPEFDIDAMVRAQEDLYERRLTLRHSREGGNPGDDGDDGTGSPPPRG